MGGLLGQVSTLCPTPSRSRQVDLGGPGSSHRQVGLPRRSRQRHLLADAGGRAASRRRVALILGGVRLVDPLDVPHEIRAPLRLELAEVAFVDFGKVDFSDVVSKISGE